MAALHWFARGDPKVYLFWPPNLARIYAGSLSLANALGQYCSLLCIVNTIATAQSIRGSSNENHVMISGANESNTSLTVDPPVPRIPGLELSFVLDHTASLRPIEVYQTAIQMMYDLAQRSWTEQVLVVDSQLYGNYKVLILFVNPQPPEAAIQLQVKHCVSGLYRAILLMTESVLFCQMRCHLSIHSEEIAGLSITTVDDAAVALTNMSSVDQVNEVDESSREASIGVLSVDHGQFKDPDIPAFVINYHFFGKSINAKDVSMAVLEALTAAAPHPIEAECQELSVASSDGGCAIIIESLFGRRLFTYRWATRALKLLYQQIVVPQKRFGDVYLELRYDGYIFGELRMLRIVDGQIQNATVAVARK